MTAAERVARHYERRADRMALEGRGAAAWFYRQWARKVREGRTNALVRRVQKLMTKSDVNRL